MTDVYLTVPEVAERIRESQDTVRRRCLAGQIRATKLGNSWRIAESDLALFMSGVRVGTPRKRLTKRQREQLGVA